MSRREEVEKRKRIIRKAIHQEPPYEIHVADDYLEELTELALSSIPTRYTPREEVTEGWYVARGLTATEREPVEVMRLKRDGRLHVVIMGSEPEYELSEWADFLPVPALLVEGLKDG